MIRELLAGWNQYWFAPQSPACMTVPRIAICLVSAMWFASFWSSAAAWVSDDGLLQRPLAAQMLIADQTPAWQVWSPLWLVQSAAWIQTWLAVGVVLSLLGASGLGGRLTLTFLCLWTIAWANRLVALSGLVEPMLIASLGYLIVDPGVPLTAHRRSADSSWSTGLALRLLQTHWWLLVAAGLLSQLGGLVWWRGEAVWWLAAAGRSNWLSTELIRGQASWINALTHVVIVVQILALWLLTVPTARPVGIGCGVLVACVYGGVADYGLYAVLLLAVLTSFACRAPERSLQDEPALNADGARPARHTRKSARGRKIAESAR